jgi:hypothetical protein
MITKIKEKFLNTNKLTKILFKYGFIFSYIIFIVGIYALTFASNYQNYCVAQEIIKTSFSVLGEFIISAIFFDFLKNSSN